MNSDAELVELQETLYTSRNPTRRWLHVTRRDWIIDALRRCAAEGPTARALEVGPGSGVYLPVLAELFDEVVGSDVHDAYLDNARKLQDSHRNLTLVQDDITRTALPEASFDLVLCTEVVEHIADSKPAIASMRRLLKPGGRLVLSTPQRYSPLEMTAKIAFLPGVIDVVRWIYKEPIIPTGHINLLTPVECASQLDAAGFTIVERHTTGVYLPVVAEVGHEYALRFERWLESALRDGPLGSLLWTQYYIARA